MAPCSEKQFFYMKVHDKIQVQSQLEMYCNVHSENVLTKLNTFFGIENRF